MRLFAQGAQYFNRRSDKYNIDKTLPIGQSPTAKEAQAIADELFGLYVSEEVDKVELIYTKFVSLIASEPTIQVRQLTRMSSTSSSRQTMNVYTLYLWRLCCDRPCSH